MYGGFCYPPCQQGKGRGPVCWGECPEGTTACGVVCLVNDERCTNVVGAVTQDAMEIGAAAAGQNYLLAIKSAMSVVDGIAYPFCRGWTK